MTTRCGFVAVIGAPNAGKSTLVNALVGQKVAIVTPKAQTTRSRLMGIGLAGDAQILLIDTPGIFEPRRRLDRAMVAAAWGSAQDADAIALVVDAASGLKRGVTDLIDRLAKPPRHPKALLQEWTAARKRRAPEYKVVDASGPDHARRFTVAVGIKGFGEAIGTGHSKHGAETAAARAMLEKLV